MRTVHGPGDAGARFTITQVCKEQKWPSSQSLVIHVQANRNGRFKSNSTLKLDLQILPTMVQRSPSSYSPMTTSMSTGQLTMVRGQEPGVLKPADTCNRVLRFQNGETGSGDAVHRHSTQPWTK